MFFFIFLCLSLHYSSALDIINLEEGYSPNGRLDNSARQRQCLFLSYNLLYNVYQLVRSVSGKTMTYYKTL